LLETKKDEVSVGWRKLLNGQLHNFHSSLNIITVTRTRMILWAGHLESMWNEKHILNYSPKSERKRTLDWYRRRWM